MTIFKLFSSLSCLLGQPSLHFHVCWDNLLFPFMFGGTTLFKKNKLNDTPAV